MPNQPIFVRSDMNEAEKANTELVLGYFKRWENDFDPAEAYDAHFAPDARIRFEAGVQSPVQWDMSKWQIGADEVAAASKTYVEKPA